MHACTEQQGWPLAPHEPPSGVASPAPPSKKADDEEAVDVEAEARVELTGIEDAVTAEEDAVELGVEFPGAELADGAVDVEPSVVDTMSDADEVRVPESEGALEDADAPCALEAETGGLEDAERPVDDPLELDPDAAPPQAAIPSTSTVPTRTIMATSSL